MAPIYLRDGGFPGWQGSIVQQQEKQALKYPKEKQKRSKPFEYWRKWRTALWQIPSQILSDACEMLDKH